MRFKISASGMEVSKILSFNFIRAITYFFAVKLQSYRKYAERSLRSRFINKADARISVDKTSRNTSK